MSTPNISFEQLVAYAAGELTAPERLAVEQHIAQNPAAAAAVSLYRSLRDAARADDTVAPPAATLAAAKQLMADQLARKPAAGSGWLETLRRTVADLVFDSRPRLAAAGLRGAGESYQLAFESPAASIDLEIERYVEGGQTRFRLMGQVTPNAQIAIGTVALSAPGAFVPVTMTQADERGVFSLSTEAGTYDVLITVEDAIVILPGVEAR